MLAVLALATRAIEWEMVDFHSIHAYEHALSCFEADGSLPEFDTCPYAPQGPVDGILYVGFDFDTRGAYLSNTTLYWHRQDLDADW